MSDNTSGCGCVAAWQNTHINTDSETCRHKHVDAYVETGQATIGCLFRDMEITQMDADVVAWHRDMWKLTLAMANTHADACIETYKHKHMMLIFRHPKHKPMDADIWTWETST